MPFADIESFLELSHIDLDTPQALCLTDHRDFNGYIYPYGSTNHDGNGQTFTCVCIHNRLAVNYFPILSPKAGPFRQRTVAPGVASDCEFILAWQVFRSDGQPLPSKHFIDYTPVSQINILGCLPPKHRVNNEYGSLSGNR